MPFRSLIPAVLRDIRRDLLGYRPDILAVLLALMVLLFFGRPLLIMNELGFSMLSGIAVDHASMLDSQIKMLEFRSLYNQTMGYHSSYYGWSYFAVSFFLLLPLKGMALLFDWSVFTTLYIGLKFLHVAYTVAAALSFYALAKRFLPAFPAYALAAVTVLAGTIVRYQYIFHPEVFGVLFFNLALIRLFDMSKAGEDSSGSNPYVSFFVVLGYLVMSSLAKPSLLLVALPATAVLFSVYAKITMPGTLLYRLPTLLSFRQLFYRAAIFSVGLFVVIHPFFFIRLKSSIEKQLFNLNIHSNSPMALPPDEALMEWGGILMGQPFLGLGLVAMGILSLYLLLWLKREQPSSREIGAIVVANLVVAIYVIVSIRLYIVPGYLVVVQSVMALSLGAMLCWLVKWLPLGVYVRHTIVAVCLVLLAWPSIEYNMLKYKEFLDYKETPTYAVFEYSLTHMTPGATIAHDNWAGFPEGRFGQLFHYWNTTPEVLRRERPDYVVYDPTYAINGKTQDATHMLTDFIKEFGYQREIVMGTIEVWRAPDKAAPEAP